MRELEHRKIDPEVCPRCGNDWTEEEDTGVGQGSYDDPLDLPDETRVCPECNEKDAEHEGLYTLCYRKVLQCVSWKDDEGRDHVVHDSEYLMKDAAQDAFAVCEKFLEVWKRAGPGGSGQFEKFDVIVQMALAAQAKAKGEPDEQPL